MRLLHALERIFLPDRYAARQKDARLRDFLLLHPFAPSPDAADPWPITVVCIAGEGCPYIGDEEHVGINRRMARARIVEEEA